ncbi:hypothetical protein BpHYR1_005213 [Brachionus plicatilis]|uniref:Uncharacterized protein n=1 Tax=Brachionus plicatilis TaxID=10195 RepID=A0A3M7RNV5_BRAPC|nr:hypothetical protein BpHYR1_005213 [Brachionus plicatilis]
MESNEKYKEEIIKWEVREQEIRCKIDESERVRQELQIQNMDLLCVVDSLRSEKEVLENERKELVVNDSSNSELTNTITNDSSCSQDSAKVKDLEAIIDDLKKEMSKKDEQFQISIKVLELEIEHRLNEHNLLISNFESLQSSQQQLQNKNTDLLGQIDTLNLQNQSLQTDLTGLREMENRCNNLIENVQDLNSQIVLKDQELLNAKDQNSHLLSELDLIKVKKEEIEFLYNKSVSDQCELRDLNTEIDTLKSQLESKSLDITEFKNRINFADQQHEKMTKFFEKKITDLNAKIDSKDDLINILQSEINTLKSNEKFNKSGNLAYGENISSSDPGTQINILNNIVQNQKLLIDKLEKESKKMCFLYEKLIYAQSRLISKQGQCYNDALHSLINSFQDLDPSQIDHKVQEIESDLNNLIHVLNNIKDNDLENAPSDTLGSPYSLQSLRQFISQHSSPVKVSDSVNSLTDELEINSHQDGTFQEENLKHKNSTSLLLMVKKCDAETQCDINYFKDDHTGTLRLSTDFNEINNLQDLIANYLNLIKSYKSLLAKLDAVSVDNSELREANSFLNDEFLKLKKSNSKNQISKEVNGHRTSDLSENEKIHNLKSAYENLYSLYQQHKTESIKSYNRVHNAYIQLINSSKNNL